MEIKESKHIKTLNIPPGRGIAAQVRRIVDPAYPIARKQAADAARGRIARRVAQVKQRFMTDLSRMQRAAQQGNRRTADNIADQLRQTLRDAYMFAFNTGVQSSGLGLAQFATLFPEEIRWAKSAATHEMRFFNRLLGEVIRGKPISSVLFRIRMYGDALWGAYSAGRVSAGHPHSLIYWKVDRLAENCPDCLKLEANSPYTKRTLPTTPRAGHTKCLSNCKCKLRIVVADEGTMRAHAFRHGSAHAVSRWLKRI